ncbi:radical SAM family heme chaperone HemW [Pelagibius marinus]|uniref:radical SAM family heme chaperone HemW n=1 Tax=Pelagibius marinus TaxID=2762760 RepID=UPI0018726A4C|nr:radical SAM family heme chaperone HemW [Pelagibius marinus]
MTGAPAVTRPETGAQGEAGFGIYLHWPFCRSKCPYCDFNSHVREAVDQDRWRAALLADLAHAAEKSGPREVTSVFFGGGTPSLMPPETVAALIEKIDALWGLAPGTEITLEANPTSAEAESFAGFARAGVNRLSLGVQALGDEALKFLGRQHTAAEALGALELARAAFPRISFDLIYARPGQSLAAWQAELAEALALGPEHISLYQLTIEEGTVFHGAWRRGELRLPEEEAAAALFEATAGQLEDAGLPAYEISNHARPGAQCRHNLTYWRYGDYVGVGPGAHGRLTFGGTKQATREHRAPEAWLDLVERQGHGWRQVEAVTPEQRLAEMVMMGLRLTEGISRAALARELQGAPEELLPVERLQRLSGEGYLEVDETGLRATAAGRQRLDALLGYLLA